MRSGSVGGSGVGSTEGAGNCHSYAPDGRCISILKILFSNWCVYDCLYCVNCVSSDVPRARFRVDEVVQLTLDFYRRNVIEGLFLSSGIIQSADYTMEQVIEVARQLREEHDFRGYIHLKTIPDASDEMIARAGLYADRLSINLELASRESLATLAPEKNALSIKRSMGKIRLQLEDYRERLEQTRVARSLPGANARQTAPPLFAPAGQSTQIIVGADASSDRLILQISVGLYQAMQMKRVYYSAFSPIPHASARLPAQAAPLMREHRPYQADWLIRFYGFEEHEIVAPSGMLSLEHDPKLAWAMAHPEFFPVDLNRAPREHLLRVPGLGLLSVKKMRASRRVRTLRLTDLPKLRVSASKVVPFVVLADHRPCAGEKVSFSRAARLQAPPQSQPASASPVQLSLAWG